MRTKSLPSGHPFEPFVREGLPVVLDGGLATTLEDRGHVLADHLWSARLLLDAPDDVAQVHTAFLEAGADCIATATYQATVPGFRTHGVDDTRAVSLIRRAVDLAVGARDRFWHSGGQSSGALRPLVAASVGPYGAFLADGSEYTGDYDIDEDGLYDFHRERWQILAAAGADLLACETIPSRDELRALLRLIDETPGGWAWISFSCADESRLADGTSLEDAARLCDAVQRVAGVGVNCVPPELVGPCIATLPRRTDKPLIVYPNSGERYDAISKSWSPAGAHGEPAELANEWRRGGATGIGGCCRIGPDDIRRLRRSLLGPSDRGDPETDPVV